MLEEATVSTATIPVQDPSTSHPASSRQQLPLPPPQPVIVHKHETHFTPLLKPFRGPQLRACILSPTPTPTPSPKPCALPNFPISPFWSPWNLPQSPALTNSYLPSALSELHHPLPRRQKQ